MFLTDLLFLVRSPEGDDNASGGGGNKDEKSDTVKREAYERLLGEKKAVADAKRAADAELDKYREKERLAAEEEAKRKGEWEKIAADKDKEITELKTKYGQLDESVKGQRKLGAFIRSAGNIDPKFYDLIDLNKIDLDAEGKIDDSSVKKYAEAFKKQYPETFQGRSGNGIPPTNPKGGSGTELTKEQWEALPLKEKKARMGDVKL